MIAPVTDKRNATRAARPLRQVRLEAVVRRDAAQRLSLALSLLARVPAPRQPQLVPGGPEECPA